MHDLIAPLVGAFGAAAGYAVKHFIDWLGNRKREHLDTAQLAVQIQAQVMVDLREELVAARQEIAQLRAELAEAKAELSHYRKGE